MKIVYNKIIMLIKVTNISPPSENQRFILLKPWNVLRHIAQHERERKYVWNATKIKEKVHLPIKRDTVGI